MFVRDLMTRDVQCVRANFTIAEAAELMRRSDVGVLPVCGDDERLVGIVTDRDIAIRGTAPGFDPQATPVAEVMTEQLAFCYENDELENAAKVMERNQVRRLLVIDADKKLCGIVSIGDLATRGDDAGITSEVLEQVSEHTTIM